MMNTKKKMTIEEYHLDALTLRCWNEMETYMR